MGVKAGPVGGMKGRRMWRIVRYGSKHRRVLGLMWRSRTRRERCPKIWTVDDDGRYG